MKLKKENTEDVITRLANKGKDAREDIEKILALDTERRSMIAETEALKGFYEKLGKLRLVEGNQPIEDVNRDIMAALGE